MNDNSPAFFDTHAHLDYPEYDQDREAVLDRAKAAGITRIISIGTDLASSRRALELSNRYPEVFAVVGHHPGNVLEAPTDIRSDLRELAAQDKVVALGETGLDYHHLPGKAGGDAAADKAYKERQAELFRQHLEVAAEMGLNCVIHNRDAFEDTLALLGAYAGKLRGVFHCFVDAPAMMRRVLDLGSLVSFTGIVTFKNAQTVRETLAAVPPDGFMLETDCPYLAPVPYRGKRCEPAHVKEIAQMVAGLRGCSLDELSQSTCATAESFFRFDRSSRGKRA